MLKGSKRTQSRVEKLTGCNLSYYMKKAGMTFEELATKTGMSEKTLRRYSKCESFPPLDRCFDIASVFGVHISQIWGLYKN